MSAIEDLERASERPSVFKMQIIILFNISIRLSQSLIRHRSEVRVRAAVTTEGTPPA